MDRLLAEPDRRRSLHGWNTDELLYDLHRVEAAEKTIEFAQLSRRAIHNDEDVYDDPSAYDG